MKKAAEMTNSQALSQEGTTNERGSVKSGYRSQFISTNIQKQPPSNTNFAPAKTPKN